MDMISTFAASDRPSVTSAYKEARLNPVGGGGGGGSANSFPIILGGSRSLIGYVLGNSPMAIKIFKYVAASGDSTIDMDSAAKDESLKTKTRNLLTTDDFAAGAPFAINDGTGYLDLFNCLNELDDAYQAALATYNNSHENADVRGVVSYCVTGNYAVRPRWAKKSGTGSDSAGTGDNTTATQYYLSYLDFGTEAQLATFDGTKYLCDYDETGAMRKTPVVKRVYTSACPNEPGRGAGT